MSAWIEVELQNGHVVLIDKIDSDLLSLYGWYARKEYTTATFYVSATFYKGNKKTTLQLHRLILERMLGRALSKRDLTDHINRNGLDNRRSNLRLATSSQNRMNSNLRRDNSSGHCGVCWDKVHNKWRAQINIEGKRKFLGRFRILEDAIAAYQETAKKYYGEFAPQDSK